MPMMPRKMKYFLLVLPLLIISIGGHWAHYINNDLSEEGDRSPLRPVATETNYSENTKLSDYNELPRPLRDATSQGHSDRTLQRRNSLQKSLVTRLTPARSRTELRNNRTTERLPSKGRPSAALSKNWGSHPLGPLSFYKSTDVQRWTAYFFDQAIAVILQDTSSGVFLNCTLQEVIYQWEQREALQWLGKAMPLVPVSFEHMVQLVSTCDMFNPPRRHRMQKQIVTTTPGWFGTALQGILPGTLWCGKGDQAEFYYELGSEVAVDRCCRAHDHCPIKLRPLMTKYGVTNVGLNTKSHCECDRQFFTCLQDAEDELANSIGHLFFNVIKVQCLDVPVLPRSQTSSQLTTDGDATFKNQVSSRLECTTRDQQGQCRMWMPNPKGFTGKLVVTTSGVTF